MDQNALFELLKGWGFPGVMLIAWFFYMNKQGVRDAEREKEVGERTRDHERDLAVKYVGLVASINEANHQREDRLVAAYKDAFAETRTHLERVYTILKENQDILGQQYAQACRMEQKIDTNTFCPTVKKGIDK